MMMAVLSVSRLSNTVLLLSDNLWQLLPTGLTVVHHCPVNYTCICCVFYVLLITGARLSVDVCAVCN